VRLEGGRAARIRWHVVNSLHAEKVDRPRGEDLPPYDRGTVVRNDGILWFAPAAETLEVAEVDKDGARSYYGRLYVTVDNAGTLAVVNAVPEDRLLMGLVPAEMLPSAPPEALKAQAVAARNQLLAKLGTRHLTDPYRLCSTEHCQVYAGAGHEDPRATAAVQATRGELLVRDGAAAELVDTVYSASCGGHTEDNDSAWGTAPDPSLRGVPDSDGGGEPYCARPKGAAASFRWTTPIDLASVAARAGTGPLTAVEVLGRGVSGRATRLRLRGTTATKEIDGELAVRRVLGGLKSSLVTLEARSDGGRLVELSARGAGHGHGVGLCQWGAVGMAEAGASYRDILGHYYAHAHLRKLY
jgi:SpoIID/LytB domain protein